MMHANIGTLDRLARALIGVVLIALTLTGMIGIWGWIGVIPLATAVISFCPLYTMLGFSTRHHDDEHADHHTSKG